MFELIHLAVIIPAMISIFVFVALIYCTYQDWKNPPKSIHYIWRAIWPDYKGEWERGNATEVYCEQYTQDIRGKVVRQKDGLYLATMWNGEDKEFIMDYEAKKWVEQYKARIYK